MVKEGRRGYMRMHGPEYLSDEELLSRAIARVKELEPGSAGIGADYIGVGA